VKIVRSALLPAFVLVLASALTACGDDSGTESSATDVAASDKPAEQDHSDESHSEEGHGSTDKSSEPAAQADQVIAVTVADGEITPKPGTVDVALNDLVTIEVTSDVAEEIHVHGYDKMVDLEPNKAASLTLEADIPGVFEVELEQSAKLLFEMEVK
jgi:hypothetical protein